MLSVAASPLDDGSVWVTDGSSRSVVRVDARRGGVRRQDRRRERADRDRVRRALSVGRELARRHGLPHRSGERGRHGDDSPSAKAPTALPSARGAVWVSGEFSEQIARIDPCEEPWSSNEFRSRTVRKGLAISEGRVWFAVQSSGVGHRGGRLVVGARGLIEGSIDPSYWSWAGTTSSLSAAYDGLVGYARRGGSEGGQIVPNLAISLPEVTRGVEPGTSSVCAPTSGTRTERQYGRATFGARSSARLARSCSEGTFLVEGSNDCTSRTRQVRSQARRPDERRARHDRLPSPATGQRVRSWALTLLAPDPTRHAQRGTLERRPVPVNGAVHDRELRPGPGANACPQPATSTSGPSVARPDGFPDEIEFAADRPRNAIPAVEARAGRLRRLSARSERRSRRSSTPSGLATRRGSTCTRSRRRSSCSSTRRVPPSTTSASGAHSTTPSTAPRSQGRMAGPSITPLRPVRSDPPSTVGFRRYCPYTAAASGTGEWRAPDVTGARRLVAAIGNAGHEGDGLDVSRFLGGGRKRAGPQHSTQLGLPGEHQASRRTSTRTSR